MPAVTTPPGLLMYSRMSRSGSSASRKSICAMTRFAMLSSIEVPMKMMLSLSRREKMSYARSPRFVCSTTIGINCEWGEGMEGFYRKRPGLVGGLGHRRVLDEPRHRLLATDPRADAIEGMLLLEPLADGRRRAARA